MDYHDDPKFIIIPVSWEGTVSYGKGTAKGPEAVRAASSQIDLVDYDFGSLENVGINYVNDEATVKQLTEAAKKDAKSINEISIKLDNWVFETCKNFKAFVMLLGGEHSISLGGFKNTHRKFNDYSVLQLDAHMDMRKEYQGYVRSHASVFYNLMTSDFKPRSLVQVGIRDFCKEELEFQKARPTVHTFFDREVKEKLHRGISWYDMCNKFVEKLEANVHISLDIDVLEPQFCTGTGTPVPGGLSFDELVTLLKVVSKERKIVGADLVEIAPLKNDNNLNANIGMRLLYKLIGFASQS